MKTIKNFFRLVHINFILAKFGLDELIVSLHLFSPLRFIVYLNPYNWRRKKLPRGVAVRLAIESLGPIFIKFGQALSTRPDLIPPDIAKELEKLQDKVPPFSSEIALEMIEKAFGAPYYEIFAAFDEIPLASASMAQVHAATLKSGESVVVKILRPNLHEIVQRDVTLIHTLAELAERYIPGMRRFKAREMVEEFSRHLLDELDMPREAANANQLRRNFEHSSLLYVPKIYWDYVHENILVMERIHGIPVTDLDSLYKHNINTRRLAERGVELFFTQVFRDCFFHADMHPGNIFVSYEHPDNPQYICVDFGIIGTLNDKDKYYIAENLLAFFNRDYRRVASLHIESGWVARSTRIDEFESAIRTVCEPIFARPLKDISFGQLIMRLLNVGRRFEMDLQPQLILLQKTLLAVEGLARQLYPELNLWVTAKPFLERWLREQIGFKEIKHQLTLQAAFLTEQLPTMPRLAFDVLTLLKEQKLRQLETTSSKKMNTSLSNLKGFGLGLLTSGASFLAIKYLPPVSQQITIYWMWGIITVGAFIFAFKSKKQE